MSLYYQPILKTKLVAQFLFLVSLKWFLILISISIFISYLIVTAKNYIYMFTCCILHCNFFYHKNVTFSENCCAKNRDICATTLTKCDIFNSKKLQYLYNFTLSSFALVVYIIKCILIIFLKMWHFCSFVPKPRHLCYKTEQKCDLFT